MRNYNITKYEGNTHYSVDVTDSFGRETGSFFKTKIECWKFIYEVWENEKPLTEDEINQKLLESAIHISKQIDKKLTLK